MAKFIFAYHGGSMPQNPEDAEKVMKAWNDWMQGLGAALIDGGAPVGKSHTVSGSGVALDGGTNPLSGYSLVEATDQAAAVEMARGCPIIHAGGSVEVAECMAM